MFFRTKKHMPAFP